MINALLFAFVQGAIDNWHTPEEIEIGAQRIEELGPLPSDEEILAVVHAFVERAPAALRAADRRCASDPPNRYRTGGKVTGDRPQKPVGPRPAIVACVAPDPCACWDCENERWQWAGTNKSAAALADRSAIAESQRP